MRPPYMLPVLEYILYNYKAYKYDGGGRVRKFLMLQGGRDMHILVYCRGRVEKILYLGKYHCPPPPGTLIMNNPIVVRGQYSE